MTNKIRNLLRAISDAITDDGSFDWERETPLAFYQIASRTINHDRNVEGKVRKDLAFFLYGALCFSLVPITTYILAPNPNVLIWYAANLAIKGTERFFQVAIPSLSVLCVSLVALSFTAKTGRAELMMRNGTGLLIWLLYFVSLSDDILRDVALKSDILRQDDSGTLHLQPEYEQCQASAADLLSPTLVHELSAFFLLYIYIALSRFRELMQIRNRRTNLNNWSDLLRQVAMNNGTTIVEEQRF